MIINQIFALVCALQAFTYFKWRVFLHCKAEFSGKENLPGDVNHRVSVSVSEMLCDCVSDVRHPRDVCVVLV